MQTLDFKHELPTILYQQIKVCLIPSRSGSKLGSGKFWQGVDKEAINDLSHPAQQHEAEGHPYQIWIHGKCFLWPFVFDMQAATGNAFNIYIRIDPDITSADQAHINIRKYIMILAYVSPSRGSLGGFQRNSFHLIGFLWENKMAIWHRPCKRSNATWRSIAGLPFALWGLLAFQSYIMHFSHGDIGLERVTKALTVNIQMMNITTDTGAILSDLAIINQ